MKSVIVWLESGGTRIINDVVQMEVTRWNLTLYVGMMRDKVQFHMSDVYKADVVQETMQLACL